MKTYVGKRTEAGANVVVWVDSNRQRPLHHVVFHSPTGFEWGYAGSGPADLALSILADYLHERPSKKRLESWNPPHSSSIAMEQSLGSRTKSNSTRPRMVFTPPALEGGCSKADRLNSEL